MALWQGREPTASQKLYRQCLLRTECGRVCRRGPAACARLWSSDSAAAGQTDDDQPEALHARVCKAFNMP